MEASAQETGSILLIALQITPTTEYIYVKMIAINSLTGNIKRPLMA